MKKENETAYHEIFKVLKKYDGLTVFDIEQMKTQSEYHLFGLKLKEDYGLNICPENINSLVWNKFGEHMSVAVFGKKHRRIISWSDDGRQPQNELMLNISFPTGAYIFGRDYNDILFKEFFLELKSYGAKYCDSHNSNLYFPIETAANVFNSFNSILAKYEERYSIESKKLRIEKIKKELAEIEGGTDEKF